MRPTSVVLGPDPVWMVGSSPTMTQELSAGIEAEDVSA